MLHALLVPYTETTMRLRSAIGHVASYIMSLHRGSLDTRLYWALHFFFSLITFWFAILSKGTVRTVPTISLVHDLATFPRAFYSFLYIHIRRRIYSVYMRRCMIHHHIYPQVRTHVMRATYIQVRMGRWLCCSFSSLAPALGTSTYAKLGLV